MLSVKNGGILGFKNDAVNGITEDTQARIFCVLEGEVSFGENNYNFGDCLCLSAETEYEISAENTAKCAWFDIDGDIEAYDFSFHEAYADKLELLAKLAENCANATELMPNFGEGIARALFSIINAEQDEESCGNKYVDMAKRYIDDNFSSQIKVEDIAARIGVDRKYLRNLFFKYIGMSTKDYLMNVRIEKAKALLFETELSVGEISQQVGYTDALAFSKIFKKHVGVSPSEFRNGNETAKEKEEAFIEPQKEDIKYFLL